jgi:hypothetical protein
MALSEEHRAVPCEDGVDRDIEHVDQVLLQQGLREKAVAPDEKVSPARANGQPALAAYTRARDGGYNLNTLQVFTVTESGVSRNTAFQDRDLFATFGLPGKITGAEQRH